MAMQVRVRGALPLLALATALAAQVNNTVPAALQGVEGGTGSSIPFGTNQPARFQCIYDRAELPWSGPRVLQAITLRADNTTPGTTAFLPKGYVVVSVLVSTTAASAATASATFADNWGNDRTWVIVNQPMMLPSQPAQPGVRAANIDFVFATPWAYGLTPARPGHAAPENFLFEIQVLSQPAGSYRLDNLGSCQSPPLAFGNQGPLCAPAGGVPLELVPGDSMQAGGVFGWRIDHAEPHALATLIIDATNAGMLLGQPALTLPVPLFDPQNPAQPFPPLAQAAPMFRFGAPDCWFNIAPAVLLFTAADAAGTATVSVPVPAGRSLVGQSLYAQAAAYSQTANALQFTTSLGQRSTVCGPLGTARIYALGSATAAVGQVGYGQGAVLDVR